MSGIARRDAATAEWFDALAQDRLLLRVCPLGHWSRADVLSCDVCLSDELSWRPSSGSGRVVSHAVDHAAGVTVVVVELAEGPWLVTRIDELPDGGPVVNGCSVRVRVVHPGEGESYPVVVPDADPA